LPISAKKSEQAAVLLSQLCHKKVARTGIGILSKLTKLGPHLISAETEDQSRTIIATVYSEQEHCITIHLSGLWSNSQHCRLMLSWMARSKTESFLSVSNLDL